jgi:glycosyltransferase involved in cell wall biosynthesis
MTCPRDPPGVLFLAEHVDAPEAELIRRLHLAGHRVALLTDPERRFCAPLVAAGIPVHDLRLRARFDPAGIRTIRAMLDEGRWDVLHFLHNRCLANGLRAARGRGLRTVAYRGALHLSLRSLWLYRIGRVDHVACISKAVRNHMLARGIPARQLSVIYKGHDPDAYRPAPRAALAEWDLPADAFTVGCAAALRRGKGIDDLIRAMARLPSEPRIHLLLVGEIRDTRLPRLANASPARDRIHFTGPRADAPALMGACDLFVMPTRQREGLGKAPMEAMAQGVPAVVTDAGGLPEIVTDGQDGRVIPRGNLDALAGAIGEFARMPPARRAEFGARAAETIRTRFHIDGMVEAYRQLYAELVGAE